MITREAIPGKRNGERNGDGIEGEAKEVHDNKIYYRGWRRGSVHPVSRGTHNRGISRNLDKYTGYSNVFSFSFGSDLKNLKRLEINGFHRNKEFAKFLFAMMPDRFRVSRWCLILMT